MEEQAEQKKFIEPFDVSEKDNQEVKRTKVNKKCLLITILALGRV